MSESDTSNSAAQAVSFFLNNSITMSATKVNLPAMPIVFSINSDEVKSLGEKFYDKSFYFLGTRICSAGSFLPRTSMKPNTIYRKQYLETQNKIVDPPCPCYEGCQHFEPFLVKPKSLEDKELYYEDDFIFVVNNSVTNFLKQHYKIHMYYIKVDNINRGVISSYFNSTSFNFWIDYVLLRDLKLNKLHVAQMKTLFDVSSQNNNNIMNNTNEIEQKAPACAETKAIVLKHLTEDSISTNDASQTPNVGTKCENMENAWRRPLNIHACSQTVNESSSERSTQHTRKESIGAGNGSFAIRNVEKNGNVARSNEDVLIEQLDSLPYHAILSIVNNRICFFENLKAKYNLEPMSAREKAKKMKWADNKRQKFVDYIAKRKPIEEKPKLDKPEIKRNHHWNFKDNTWKKVEPTLTFTTFEEDVKVYKSNVKVTQIGDRKIQSKIIANNNINQALKSKRNDKYNKGTGQRCSKQKSNPIQYTRNELLISDPRFNSLSKKDRDLVRASKLITRENVASGEWYSVYESFKPVVVQEKTIEWQSEILDDEDIWDDYSQDTLIPKVGYFYNLQPIEEPSGFDFYKDCFKLQFEDKKKEREIEVFAMEANYEDAVVEQVRQVEVVHHNIVEKLEVDNPKVVQMKSVMDALSASSKANEVMEQVSKANVVDRTVEVIDQVKNVTETFHSKLICLDEVKNDVSKSSMVITESVAKISNKFGDTLGNVDSLLGSLKGAVSDIKNKLMERELPIDLIMLELGAFFLEYDNNITCIYSLSKAVFNIVNYFFQYYTGKPLSLFSVPSFMYGDKVTQSKTIEELFSWIPLSVLPSLKELQCFNTICTAFRNFMCVTQKIQLAFMDLLGWLFPRIFSGMTFYNSPEYNDTMKYVMSLKSATTFKDATLLTQKMPMLKVHFNRLEKWALEAATSFVPTQYALSVRNAMQELNAVAKAQNAGLTYKTSRPRPLGIMIRGPTSIGKSTIVNVLGKILAVAAKKEYSYYPRTTGTENWDGYTGQYMVLYDDFGQSTDFEEVPEIFSVISTNPFLPPMASLDNPSIGIKGTFMTSEVVIATTNLDNFRALDRVIHSPEALSSRFPISIRMEWINQNDHNPKGDYSHAKFELTLTKGLVPETDRNLNLSETVGKIVAFYREYMLKAKQTFDDGGDLTTLVEGLIEEHLKEPEAGNTFYEVKSYYTRAELAWKESLARLSVMYTECANESYNRAYTALQRFINTSKSVMNKVVDWIFKNAKLLFAVVGIMTSYLTFRRHMAQERRFQEAIVAFERANNADAYANAFGCAYEELCACCKSKTNSTLGEHGISVYTRQTESYAPRSIKKAQSEVITPKEEIIESYSPRTIRRPQNAETRKYAESIEASHPEIAEVLKHPVSKMGNIISQGFVDPTSVSLANKLTNSIVILIRGANYVQAIPICGTYYLTVSHFFRTRGEGWNLQPFQMRDGVTIYNIVLEESDIHQLGPDTVILDLPNLHPPRPNLVKNFCREDEISYVVKQPETNYKIIVLTDENAKAVQQHHFQSYKYEPDVSYTCPETLNTYTLRDTFSYSLNSQAGWCGAPVILENNKVQGKIIGIHSWGITGIAKGGCAIVSRESLEKFFMGKAVPQQFLIPEKNQYAPSITGICELKNYVKNTRKTRIHKSQFFEHVPTIKRPANLSSITLIENSIKKFSRNVFTVKRSVLKRVENHIVSILNKLPMNDLDIREDYNSSISAYQDLAGINLTTSPGYPWVDLNLDKRKLIDNSDGNYKIIDPDLLSVLEYRERCYANNVVPFTIWTSCCKDELLKPGKDTRLFEIGPIEQVIHGRRLFATFMDFFHRNHCKFFSAVGMNPESIEWHEMVRHLISFGDNGLFSDWKHFDCTELSCFMFATCRIINAWYDRNVKDGKSRDRMLFFTEGMFRYTKVGNLLLLIITGLASGWLLTTIVNTINNAIIHFYIYLELAPVEYASLRYLHRHSAMYLYGDDAVISVSDEIAEFYNSVTIASEAEKFGMFMQSDKKGDEVVKTQHILDLTFLKRSVRSSLLNNHFVPLLNMESMMCMIAFYTESKVITIQESHQAIVDSFCQFAYFYGPDFYDYFINLFSSYGYICHDFEYYDNLFTYNACFDLSLY